MDKVIIKGLKIFAYHGVNIDERIHGQPFVLDLELFADISASCKSDNLDDTINYSHVVKSVTRIMTSEKNLLIERAAGRVADGLFEEFPLIDSLKICIKKPASPIKAELDFVGVEIERTRGNI